MKKHGVKVIRTSEAQHQAAVFDVLRLNARQWPQLQFIHASMNGVASRSVAAAVARKRQGQVAGVADIFVPFPINGESGLWLELKAEGGRLSVEQKAFLAEMAERGYRTRVCWSADEALEAIENYLGVRLNRG